DDGGVGFYHVFWRVNRQLLPGDLLVRHSPGVRSITGGRIADLAEVAPERNVLALQVLAQHGHDADRKVTRNAAADLEKADGLLRGLLGVPLGQRHHVLDAGAY